MTSKTVAFFGASTGIGHSALKHSLAAGYQCIALCRNPSKLTSVLTRESWPNLQVVQGNAHDTAAVSRCLKASDNKLVDEIVFTIGGKPIPAKMTIDDPHVCEKGITTVLNAILTLRGQGVVGRPHIIVCSTAGMSEFGRDIPVTYLPLFSLFLKVPGADKRAMENKLVASGEDFTIVRAAMFLNDGETNKQVRAGVEDPQTGIESKAIGYSISREDAGKWIARNLVVERNPKYLNKTATIVY
ncbi:NAD(P)-binding protein [Daldinia caldariorum]|uniref:NAD(P)-binding protein n=1 Tax=Daldinia caldariorum TaxID=326644 RepID=UPI0020082ED0|nr:NAD(P)-binding protein [Daldinia caldariorum]KAI1467935.1 NAD(P)-binding protein [Daldinia caldariorum]